jgi:hypothetical protein
MKTIHTIVNMNADGRGYEFFGIIKTHEKGT